MTQQRILGIAGKKQSGKNTCANFLTGLELVNLKIVTGGFALNELGQILITDLFGNEDYAGILDLTRQNKEFLTFLETEINPFVKIYSFADLLKQEVCIKILGLTHEQCYGADADKNSPTKLRWEDMPGVYTKIPKGEKIETISGRLGAYYQKSNSIIYHAAGVMTAREVLQFVGTEVFRKMYQDVWVDATIRRIKEENSLFAIICDTRFPNEVMGIKEAGGKVIRLTRNPAGDKDAHPSETALDKENFDWANFDAVIDNKDMSIEQQNTATLELLTEWKWAEIK